MAAPLVVSQLRQYIDPGFRTRYSERIFFGIERLLTHEDVFPVWRALALDRDSTLPYSFIDACAHAMWTWDCMPHVPDQEMKQNLAKLAADAESLADALDRHASEVSFSGIEMVVGSYRAHPPTARSGSLNPYFEDVQGPVSVQLLLREFAQRLIAPHEASLHELRPTRARAKDAERTFLVKAVAQFFLTRGKEHPWNWVVRSVSALTNTLALEDRHAQLLCSEFEGRCWDNADDYQPDPRYLEDVDPPGDA